MQSTIRINADASGSARSRPNPLVQLVTDIVRLKEVSVLEDSLCCAVRVWIVCPNRIHQGRELKDQIIVSVPARLCSHTALRGISIVLSNGTLD
jgi:hypothetical protein